MSEIGHVVKWNGRYMDCTATHTSYFSKRTRHTEAPNSYVVSYSSPILTPRFSNNGGRIEPGNICEKDVNFQHLHLVVVIFLSLH